MTATTHILPKLNSGFALLVTEGCNSGDLFLLERRTMTVGRSSNVDIQLVEPVIPRRRCLILWSNQTQEHFLELWEHRTGIWLNGQKCRTGLPHALREGDVVKIGDTVMVYEQVTIVDTPAD